MIMDISLVAIFVINILNRPGDTDIKNVGQTIAREKRAFGVINYGRGVYIFKHSAAWMLQILTNSDFWMLWDA